MLEAGARGLPIIGLRISEAPILNGSDGIANEDFGLHFQSIEEFTASLELMIAKRSLRYQKTARVKQSIERIHFPPGWNHFLDDIIQSLPSEHNPKLINSSRFSPGSTDIFWAGLQAAALKNPLQQFNLDLMFVQHGRYASKDEWIKDILRILLKTHNMPTLRNTIYVLKKTVHGYS